MDRYETITIETKDGKLIERRGLVVETRGGAVNAPIAVAVGNTLYRYVEGTIGLFRSAGPFTKTMVRDVR